MRYVAEALTDRQAEVLHFIARHICEAQRPPTRAEIGRHIGARSADCHVKALCRKGYVSISRYVRIVRWPDGVLPILKLTRG